MELRHLKAFVKVADEGNLTQAARQLHVAQPALGRQIRALEDELGIELFHRSAQGMALTESGKHFYDRAKALLAHSDEVLQSVRETPSSLQVGYVWGLFHSLTPSHVATFRQAHPKVSVSLHDLSATAQAEALRNGSLDLGYIGFDQEAEAAALQKCCVGRCAFRLVLPEKHPLANHDVIELEALREEMFIIISEAHYPSASKVLHEACARAGFRPRAIQGANRGHDILGLIAANAGVSLLPASLEALPHRGVAFRPLSEPIERDLYVAWNGANTHEMREAYVVMLERS